MDTPTVGRIVHYVMDSGMQHRPAIIVRVWGNSVQLQVFTDNSNDGVSENVQWKTSVMYSEEPKPFTWHWPERA